MSKARIIVAEDQPQTANAITSALQPDYEIFATGADQKRLLDLTVRVRPNAVIADADMKGLDWMSAAAKIKAALPDVKLLFVSSTLNKSVLPGRDRPASGFLLRSYAPDEIKFAIGSVLRGQMYLPANIGPGQFTSVPGTSEDTRHRLLSTRERGVIRLIMEGRTSKEIGVALGISVWTVNFHRKEIRKKLRMKSRAELVRFAVEHGLALSAD